MYCIIIALGILLVTNISSINAILLFEDGFDRADSGTIGNGWVKEDVGDASANITGKRLEFYDYVGGLDGDSVSIRKNLTINFTEVTFDFNPLNLSAGQIVGGGPPKFEFFINNASAKPVGANNTYTGIYITIQNNTMYNWLSNGSAEIIKSNVGNTENLTFNFSYINYTDNIFNMTVVNSSGFQENYTSPFYRNVSLKEIEFFISNNTYVVSPNSIYYIDNVTITGEPFTENNHSYNVTTSETKPENYLLNITYDSSTWDSVSANLIYNGTSYSSTSSTSGGDTIFSASLDVPLLPSDNQQNRTFYWQVILVDSLGSTNYVNTSSYTQTVDPLLFLNCNSTYPDRLVNFTTYEEDNLTSINVSFDATFNFSINGSSLYKNYSFSSPANNDTFQFCSNVNDTLNVDSTINLFASGYDERTYYFNDKTYVNTSITEEHLYLLANDLASDIIIEVRDQGLQPLEGYYVDIDRYYPEDNSYVTIISEQTDEFGQFVASLVQNSVKYRFIFKNTTGDTVKTTGLITVACRTTICVIPFVVEVEAGDFDRFDNVTGFTSTLSFDNSTNIFTLTWNDVTGDSATFRLVVERILINGTAVVCNQSSTSSSDSLTCNVGSSNANYRAQFYRQVSGGSEKRISVLTARVGTTFGTFGLEGLIWAFLLVFTLFAVGSYNPTIGAILYFVSTIMLGIIGIISLNAVTLISNLVIVVLFIWAFRS